MDKEQSKPIESLSFEQLFQMGEQKYEELDYDEAEYFYSLAYNKNPFNQAVVMCYANLLKQNDKVKQASKILQKSIKDYPNGTYKRYFELGEIYHGVQAIKSFQTGIAEALKSLKNPFKNVTPEAETRRDIAQAYASVAEICMTDLIDQPQAEVKCTESLQKGIKTDMTCLDVHLQMANYQLFKENFEIAKGELDIIYTSVKAKKQQYENQLVLQAAKYFIELEEYDKSSQLLQIIHEQQSNETQVVYLLAYCAFKAQRYQECEDFVEEYEEGENNIVDEEIEEAMKELIGELKKVRKVEKKNSKKGEEMEHTGEQQQEEFLDEEEWMDVEDEEN